MTDKAALEVPQPPAVNISELPDLAQMPEGLQDLALDFVKDFLPQNDEAPVTEEVVEASEDVETDVSEGEVDELPTEADELELEDDVELSDEQSFPDSVVDYNELKNHTLQFKVGGEMREMTIDQIASELGQVKAATKSQGEVKAQQDELAARREALESEMISFRQQQELAVEGQELATKAANIQRYQQALDQAASSGDTNKFIQIQHALGKLQADYNATQQRIEESYAESQAAIVEQQAEKLNELGYGSLLTDTQRREALVGYIESSLSPTAAQAVNYDATLMAAVEKARLWDAAQKKTGKIKTGNGKTLKAGAAKLKPAVKKEGPKTTLDIAKQILGQT